MHDSLFVNEIFFSLQGESSYAGRPCVFVRLTRCNLRCTYCDTEYAFHEGRQMSIEEVLHEVNRYPSDLVEITGGEPLLQAPVHKLVRTLLNSGKSVLIETGGSRDIRPVDPRAVLVYDIKCPGSGMADKNLWENLAHLRPHDEIKFVIGDRTDFEWARSCINEQGLAGRFTVLFSPVWDQLPARQLADWILEEGLNVRLQLQLHKILWGGEVRGR
jgi:7-carboxy-7-deazaguanine synthase